MNMNLPSVLWHRWSGVRKSIWPVKIEWWGVVVVICCCSVHCFGIFGWATGRAYRRQYYATLSLAVSCLLRLCSWTREGRRWREKSDYSGLHGDLWQKQRWLVCRCIVDIASDVFRHVPTQLCCWTVPFSESMTLLFWLHAAHSASKNR